MGTTVVAPEAEAQCGHLNRTQSTRPGREICDDCKQLFESGLPVKAYPEAAPVRQPKAALPQTAVTKSTKGGAGKSTALAIRETVSRTLQVPEGIPDPKNLTDEVMTVFLNAKMDEGDKLVADHNKQVIEHLEFLRPYISEMRSRFPKHGGPRTKKVMGCSTWEEYCETVLHRTKRAVNYQLSGGNTNRTPKISTHTPENGVKSTDVTPTETQTSSVPSTKPPTPVAKRSASVFENDGEYVALTINWVIKLLEPVEKTDPKRYVKLVKLITSRLTEELMEGSDGE